jgi:hypothetical protein
MVHPILPPELLKFLDRHTYSLLVKGEAATGKTILALSILKEVNATNNYLYLSTRVSPAQLFEDHPWLSGFAEVETQHAANGDKEPPEPERFVDARLDEPVPFFERITNELMDARSPTIIVDAWDPIGTMMGDDASLSNAKVLQTWRERADAKIVVLIEDSSDSKFDSLFDGVVSLDRYYDDGRIIRMIQLSKLSGVKINRPSCIFTLDSGVFQSFCPGFPLDFNQKASTNWSWQKKLRATGYRELDAILDGGAPPGTIVNLELSTVVNSAMALLLLSGILARAASLSGSLFFRPFEGIGIERATHVLGELVPIQAASRSKLESDNWESLKSQVQNQRTAQRGKKITMLVGSEFLSRAGGDDDRESLFEFMKSKMDLSIIVSRSETSVESAATVADISLKLSEIDGTPILQPQLPWTEYFAISTRTNGKHTKVSLVPIV